MSVPACLSFVVLATVLAWPCATLAQEAASPIPAVEISGGYMVMRDTEEDLTYPGGWYFSGGANFNDWFGLVGEASGSYKKLATNTVLVSFENRIQEYTFLGGPRFFYRAGRVVPFAQVLAGAAHTRSKVDLSQPVAGITAYNTSETDLAVQPGGGVTIYVSERVGVRLAADYRWLMDYSDDEWYIQNQFRATAGMTFGWGAR